MSVINAASASYAHVSAAVASAVSGDTVVVPSGTATWSSTLAVNKAISVIGNGLASTIITNSAGTAVLMSGAGDSLVRVSGFRFNSNDGDVPLKMVGPMSKVRVDHCYFNKGDSIRSNDTDKTATGPVYGVVDNCTFWNMTRCYYAMDCRNGDYNWGTAAWDEFIGNEATFPGSNKMLYFEDCSAGWDAGLPGNVQGFLYGGYGGKACVRYCSMDKMYTYIDAHGDTPDYGTIYYEIYNNTMIEDNAFGSQGDILWSRGGQLICHDNVVTGASEPYRMSVYTESDLAAHRVKNTYFWGNSWNGDTTQSSQVFVNDSGQTSAGYSAANIRLNYEYFLRQPTTGDVFYPYTPYTYPHPLRSETLLSAPAHLRWRPH